MPLKNVDVAAGVLQFPDERYLLAERPADKLLGGYLEFPGGKLEAGESPQTALVRELEEELGIVATAVEPLVQFSHDYPERRIRAYLFRVRQWRGEPHGREGQKLVRAAFSELREWPLLPANLPILSALELPESMMVTPQLDECDIGDFCKPFERSLRNNHPEGAILRLRTSQGREHGLLLQELAETASVEHCRLILNTGAVCELPTGFAGLHLPANALAKLDERPRCGGWVGASVHSVEEAEHAGQIGLDYIVAGSLRETPSHPGVAPLGWDGFDAIVRAAGIPVYAIGGMRPADLPEVRRHWGQGIAALRAFEVSQA